MTFFTMKEIIETSERKGAKISDVALEMESKETGLSADEIMKKMAYNYEIMKNSVSQGIPDELDFSIGTAFFSG
mgnify:CR=1 FL=1